MNFLLHVHSSSTQGHLPCGAEHTQYGDDNPIAAFKCPRIPRGRHLISRATLFGAAVIEAAGLEAVPYGPHA